MRKIIKASIYSLLIFPGSGFFVLRYMRTGYVFVSVTAFFLLLVIADSMYKAKTIADEIIEDVSRSGIADSELMIQKLEALPGFLPDKLSTTPGLLPDLVASVSVYVIISIWVLGVVGLWMVKRPNN